MTKMNSQRRSLSAALDMVEAAISSLENQAKQAKLFQQQQFEEQACSVGDRVANTIAPTPRLPLAANSLPTKHEQLTNNNNVVTNKKPLTQENISSRVEIEDTNETQNDDGHHKPSNSHNSISRNLHKKHKSGRKLRPVLPSALLHRSSTPRKRSEKRSSSRHHHHRSSRREKNNNSQDKNDAEKSSNKVTNSDKKLATTEHRRSSESSRAAGYTQPTESSTLREQLTEKPKKKEKTMLPFVPGGSESKSYHVGVIIQKELGQLKSQPLQVWAAAKQNAAKREAGGSMACSTILHRELTKS